MHFSTTLFTRVEAFLHHCLRVPSQPKPTPSPHPTPVLGKPSSVNQSLSLMIYYSHTSFSLYITYENDILSLFLSFWLTSLSIISFSSIHKIANNISSFFYILVIFYCCIFIIISLNIFNFLPLFMWGEGKGHTLKCLGLTPGSVLRDHSRKAWGPCGTGDEPLSASCEASSLTAVPLFWPLPVSLSNYLFMTLGLSSDISNCD